MARHLLTLLISGFALSSLLSPGVTVAQPTTGDWPQWRGPGRDGVSREEGLLKEWPEGGPDVVWSVETVGVSYSSIAIKDGRIFTQGDLNGVEHVLCLSTEDGRILWAVQPAPVIQELADRIEREFQAADQNSNGIIDEHEAWRRFGRDFTNYDRSESGDREQIAAQRARRLLAAIDANGDDRLTFAEADETLRDQFMRFDSEDRDVDPDELARERAAALIQAIDQNGDQKITRDEARRTELDRIFNQADQRDPNTNKGDEIVTAGELEAYLAKRQKGRDGVVTADELQGEFARAFAGQDGQLDRDELRAFFGGYRNGMGDGPRGTPTVEGNRVYVEGGNGDVSCLDVETGETVWHLSLIEDLGGSRPGWGYSESPLIEGDLLIVTPGGKSGTLAALDKLTGQVVWRSSGVTEAAHYSSPIAATIGGIREIIQFARESVFGVDAKTGELKWTYRGAANGTANCFTPIIEEDQVFVSSAYGTGSGLVRIVTNGSEQQAEEVYFLKKLQSHHGGAVKIGNYIYSNGGGLLMCVEFDTGEIAWQSRSVGKGSLVAADGMLYVLSEGHQIALVEARPDEYVERGRFKIDSHGRPSWAHPVVSGGRLYLRDQSALTAYDVAR